MNILWRVALYEYTRNVFKKSFIFTVLGVPFFIFLSISLGFILEGVQERSLPVGYVDDAGVLSQANTLTPDISTTAVGGKEPVKFIAFPSEEEASRALQEKEIQAYYLLGGDYPVSRRIRLVYLQEPGVQTAKQFYDFLQLNLASDAAPEIARRVAAGTHIFVRSLDGRREVYRDSPTFGLMMPLFISMAFLGMLMLSSGYLMSALADENENRTLEVLITSTSPGRLMSGKILGIVAISLTLLLAWTVLIVGGVRLANQAGMSWFSDLSMDWRSIWASVLLAIPAYLLAAAVMITFGVMVKSVQESQSAGFLLFILHALPLYFSWIFFNEPNGTLPVVLSLLPFTALMTVAMRNLLSVVPAWQIYTSFFIQLICACGACWLAGRFFRLSLLRYGQRMSWRRLADAVRS